MTLSSLTRTLVAVAATSALTLSARPSDARQADGPDFGAPTVGACSIPTAKQAEANTDRSSVVPCSQGHTAKVAGVVHLPGRLDYSAGSEALHRVISGKCLPRYDAMLGRTDAVRDSSAYELVWFVPTKAQRRHGARWMSCSVTLAQGAELAELPTDAVPMLPKGKLSRGIQRCLLAPTSSIITTRCTAKHGWRATGSFVVASQKYPGAKALNHRARKRCASRVQPDKAYRWTYKTKIDWQVAGDHVVVCYSETRH